MKKSSTAFLRVQETKQKFVFDGVVSISHAMTLKVSMDSDSSSGSDYVNNARNEPDVVTLAVAATEVYSERNGMKRATVEKLAEIKEKRKYCRLVTKLRSYKNMLLTDFSVLQDETCPCGWTGTLTFTQVEPPRAAGNPEDNSSTPTSTGTTAPAGGNSGGTSTAPIGPITGTFYNGGAGAAAFSQLLKGAGIEI